MKNLVMLFAVLIFVVSCGNSPKPLEREVAVSESVSASTPLVTIDSIVSNMTYPQAEKMEYKGEIIADLSSNSPVVSSVGTVSKSTTLNFITIEGIEFLVYGEDGVFATECEPNALYPDHGSTHSKCEIAHAESFDRIILCTSATANVDLAIAQNWPGSKEAMEDSTLGMVCWVNGVKMLSNKIFTY